MCDNVSANFLAIFNPYR